jgi:hypothetical protein
MTPPPTIPIPRKKKSSGVKSWNLQEVTLQIHFRLSILQFKILQHGVDDFTSPLKEGVLQILIALLNETSEYCSLCPEIYIGVSRCVFKTNIQMCKDIILYYIQQQQ